MEQSTQSRKRAACSSLVNLARDVEMATERKHRDLNKKDFEEFFTAVFKACRSPNQKKRAEGARNLFMGEVDVLAPTNSLPAVPALPVVEVQAQQTESTSATKAESSKKEFRLRCKSCLFTYNSRIFATMDREKLWESFIQFIISLEFVAMWTATMELSRKSVDKGRLHLHVFVEFVVSVDWTSVNKMMFLGSKPNAEPTVARGPKQKEVVDQGHFYCFANKEGTLKVQSSHYEPWVDYVVRGWWLDQLWTQHKITNAVYIEYAAQVRLGFVARQRQVEALVCQEKLLQLKQQQQAVAARLAGLRKPFRDEVISALKPWAEQYKTDAMRYHFLVLHGGSRTGKSTLAKALGDQSLFGFGTPYVQTVQSAESPDLRAFSLEEHGYILFDNVDDMKFILDHRATVQANNDIHVLGESKTGMYSYPVWLYCVPIVVTIDLTAQWDREELWIKENCFHIYLDQPCYQS